MNSVLRSMFAVIRGYLKFSFIKAIHPKRFSFGGLPRIDGLTEVTVEKGSTVRIGKKLNLRRGSVLRARCDSSLTVGREVSFGLNNVVTCRSSIIISDGCEFGCNVQIYDHDHDYKGSGGIKTKKYKTGCIRIGKNCWIGANTIILKDTFIGDNVVIAAGSVIKNKIIPSNSLFVQKKKETIITIEEK